MFSGGDFKSPSLLDPAGLWLDAAEFRRLLAEVETHRHRNLQMYEEIGSPAEAERGRTRLAEAQ